MRTLKLDLWDSNHQKFTISLPFLGKTSDYDTSGYPPVTSMMNGEAVGASNHLQVGGENILDLTPRTWYIDPSLAMGFHIYQVTGYNRLYIEGFMQSSQPTPPRMYQSDESYRMTDRLVLGCIEDNGEMGFCFIGVGEYMGDAGTNILYGNILPDLYAQAYKSGDPFNPYSGGGTSGTGGGDANNQNFDDDSDSVTEDFMPSIGAVGSKLVTIFSPTKAQLSHLADLLFSKDFFEWVEKNLVNLEDLFISLAMVPFNITKGSNVNVTWLGFDVGTWSGGTVALQLAAEQYYEFDMGNIAFDGSDSRLHASDSVFDYSPFSKLGIYLPFIGFEELDIDEVRGTVLNLKYRIDILSGACLAILTVMDLRGSRALYQFSGNCLTQLPLTSVDMSSIVTNSVNIAVAAAGAGTTGAVASAGDAMVEGLNGETMSALQKDYMHAQNAAKVSNANGSLASATANGMMGMKPNYKHSGAVGGGTSMFGVKQPYLFLTTPNEAVPENYQKYCGFPSNITAKLNTLSGYTVVEDIRLNGLVATSGEVDEIYQLLKSGVII